MRAFIKDIFVDARKGDGDAVFIVGLLVIVAVCVLFLFLKVNNYV